MKPKIRFRKLGKDVAGECDYKNEVITINLYNDLKPIGLIYLHEMAHWEHPEWDEDEVIAYSLIRWRSLTGSERLKIYRKIFGG